MLKHLPIGTTESQTRPESRCRRGLPMPLLEAGGPAFRSANPTEKQEF